jgi:hypothetical protein
MNTAASAKPTGYSLAKAQGKCHVCGKETAAGEKLMAAVRDTPAMLERLDICPSCWEGFDRTGLLGFWQTAVPVAAAKKHVFIDDDVLCDLFERLADAAEPAKLNFRFVLGLILMRKRRIVYESSRLENERELWSVKFRGTEQKLDLLNPRLSEQQMGEVSAQLGEILSADL